MREMIKKWINPRMKFFGDIGFLLIFYGRVCSLLFLNIVVAVLRKWDTLERAETHTYIPAKWVLTIPHYLSVAINVSLM